MKLAILSEDIRAIKQVVSANTFNELKPYFKSKLNKLSETLVNSNGLIEVTQKYLRLQISVCNDLLGYN